MSAQSKDGLEAATASFIALSTIAVGLRIYTRKSQRLPFKADDGFAVLALAMFIIAAACVLRMIKEKVIGYSRKTVPVAELIPKMHLYTELSLTFETAMNLAATFIKLSALAFYWRHFALPGCNPWIKRVIIGTAIVVSLWPIIIITVTFLQCGTHLAAYWQGTEDVYCHITKPFYPTIPLTILILDLWILMIPIPKVIKLRVSLRKRLSVMGVFLTAFATIIIYEIMYGGDNFLINRDRGVAATEYEFLTVLEAGLCLVAVNLPTLWYLCTDAFTENALYTLRSALSKASLGSNRSKTSDGSDRKARVDTNAHKAGMLSDLQNSPVADLKAFE